MKKKIKQFNRFARSNTGFSLAELIIAFALLSLVMIAVIATVSAGSNIFTTTSRQINLQYKSQAAMAQFQQYFMMCSAGITKQDDGTSEAADGSDGSGDSGDPDNPGNPDDPGDPGNPGEDPSESDDGAEEPGKSNSVIYFADGSTVYAFRFDAGDNKIYFSSSPLSTAKTKLKDFTGDPFCSDVSGFVAEIIPSLSGDNASAVKLTLIVSDGNKSFSTSQVFSFRNPAVYIKDKGESESYLAALVDTLTGG
ncbi:MAG: prepilin-type N-terminal cleavage/methylation domain-containing protein [Clostridia bacterium]|nr:prepilin-type N-terminal cleavage/methylation domain-containing protein [Clostridia bacterium]